MDITSRYTIIPNGQGLLSLKHFFDQRTDKEPSLETLLRLTSANTQLLFIRWQVLQTN